MKINSKRSIKKVFLIDLLLVFSLKNFVYFDNYLLHIFIPYSTTDLKFWFFHKVWKLIALIKSILIILF